MTLHLKSCIKKRLGESTPNSRERWFHLVIEGKYSPGYWLHVQASGKSTFEALDRVLRRLWLECCGHMSEFKFPEKRPLTGRGRPDVFARMDIIAGLDRIEDAGDDVMGETLKGRLKAGMRFSHEYDFGSTTTLSLRVAGEYDRTVLKGPIKLLARNEPPVYPCSVCGKPATQICTECLYESGGDLCDACAAKHPCGEEALLPLVNSPRAGVCGYTGPSVEP